MKRKIYPTILFVLIAATVVYLFVNSPQRGFLHALSDKVSDDQEKEQNQMPLELTVLDGQVFRNGEPIKLVGKIKNVSEKTLIIHEPIEQWNNLSVYIEEKSGAGFKKMQRKVELLRPDILAFTMPPSQITLKPAEEYSIVAILTPELYLLPSIGRYRVYIEYSNMPEDYPSIWVGRVKSPITTISIVE